MEFNNILTILMELLSFGLLALVGWAVPKICQWLNIKNSDAITQEVMNLIGVFVNAAEQLLKEEDPTGEKRKQYVIEHLQALGYEITDVMLAMIENKVFELNLETKKS